MKQGGMMRENISQSLRERVLSRDGYACRYCGGGKLPFHIDHVYPVIKGGETSMGNLVTACSTCNLKKHDHVGIYPKPLGYFAEQYRSALRSATLHSTGVFIGLTGLLLMVFLRNPMFIVLAVFGTGIALAVFFIPLET